MRYTLKQAAEAAGKTKPTILRAIQAGKISASRDAISNTWTIDPAELHRVYPIESEIKAPQDTQRYDVTANEIAVLRREIELKDEKLKEFQEERERERRTLQDNIEDLRQRLNTEGEERRRLSAQVTALLTNHKTEANQPSDIIQEQIAINTEPKKGFFRRLFG